MPGALQFSNLYNFQCRGESRFCQLCQRRKLANKYTSNVVQSAALLYNNRYAMLAFDNRREWTRRNKIRSLKTKILSYKYTICNI